MLAAVRPIALNANPVHMCLEPQMVGDDLEMQMWRPVAVLVALAKGSKGFALCDRLTDPQPFKSVTRVVAIQGPELDAIRLVLQQDGRSKAIGDRLVVQIGNATREGRVNKRALGGKDVDAKMNAAPGLADVKRRPLVDRPVFAIAPYGIIGTNGGDLVLAIGIKAGPIKRRNQSGIRTVGREVEHRHCGTRQIGPDDC